MSLAVNQPVKTTCPYCGVGCGIVAGVNSDGNVVVRGDQDHPANYGRLCSKGSALGETTGLAGRLLHPEMYDRRSSWDAALSEVAQRFTSVIKQHGRQAVAFYVSGQLLTEDYYVANKLMKGFIGSANIDTNSRLCMASSVAGHKRAFGSDTVPGNYQDFELADLIVLTGSNTAWCHPVLFQRITKAKNHRPALKVVVIDPRRTATCDIADLHLPLKPGTDTILWNGLLIYLAQHNGLNFEFIESHCENYPAALKSAKDSSPSIISVARDCGLEEEDVARFFAMFLSTEKVVSAYSQGVNQSSCGTDKVNAIINCHLLTARIGHPGMGPFSITGQPNAMGGREAGGLANQLAAHMELDNPQHRMLVQQFWNSPRIADTPGLKAVELFDAMNAGDIKAVWIMATNPVVSIPNADSVRTALDKCEFVVMSDCMRHTDTTAYADVLLPALTWGEKMGTVTNSERRISVQRQFLASPGEAQPDWWIICEVAKRMGFKDAFGFTSVADIFREHAALSACENSGTRDFDIGGLARLSDREYFELKPVQWPVTSASPMGTERCFIDHKFNTVTGKARFIEIKPRSSANPLDQQYPLVLNTGRVRDHWHTMTRTGKSARLSAHISEPMLDIHPDDARRFRLSNEALACVASRWGKVIARVNVSDQQRIGSVFVPMHWNDQYARQARIDTVVNPAVDPVSGEPEFKHTPVNVAPYQPLWYGFVLSRRELGFPGISYYVKVTGNHFSRYELAGEQTPADWAVWARGLLCAPAADVEWIDYLDKAAGNYRGARLIGNNLESCVFVAPTINLPARSWLSGLFAKDELSGAERASILSGRVAKGQPDAGRIICSCFGVGENTLKEAIKKQDLTSVEAIGQRLKAGTNCGSCIPELKALITQKKR